MRTVHQLLDLTGRRAVVAGGAGHLGRASVDTLAELGANVVVLDVEEEATPRGQGEGGDAIGFVRCDLAVEDSVRDAVRSAVDRLGGLDIVVDCAALVGTDQRQGWSAPFAEQSATAFAAGLQVGLVGAFVLVQSAAPALERSGHGSVVLLNSIYGSVGPDPRLYEGTEMHNPVGYGAAKGGVGQLTRYLATMLAPAIRVNCISPGGVERAQPADFRTRYEQRTPLARMATEEDIKGAVAYLASDLSAYVTGHDLLVDGGWTAW